MTIFVSSITWGCLFEGGRGEDAGSRGPSLALRARVRQRSGAAFLGEAAFERGGDEREGITHREIEKGGEEAELDDRAGAAGLDVVFLRELDDGDNRADGGVFEEGDEKL